MKTLQHYLDEMDRLLKELVQVATQLRDLSHQVISQEELEPLQKRQEELLTQLERIDQQVGTEFRHQIDSTSRENLHDQLQKFERLNAEFIQNLKTSHGIIQFDLHRLREDNEKDFSRLPLLNKILSSKEESEED